MRTNSARQRQSPIEKLRPTVRLWRGDYTDDFNASEQHFADTNFDRVTNNLLDSLTFVAQNAIAFTCESYGRNHPHLVRVVVRIETS